MIVYQNGHYTLATTDGGYNIINMRTGVIEGTSEVLSSAISKSDVWSDLLDEIEVRKA